MNRAIATLLSLALIAQLAIIVILLLKLDSINESVRSAAYGDQYFESLSRIEDQLSQLDVLVEGTRQLDRSNTVLINEATRISNNTAEILDELRFD